MIILFAMIPWLYFYINGWITPNYTYSTDYSFRNNLTTYKELYLQHTKIKVLSQNLCRPPLRNSLVAPLTGGQETFDYETQNMSILMILGVKMISSQCNTQNWRLSLWDSWYINFFRMVFKIVKLFTVRNLSTVPLTDCFKTHEVLKRVNTVRG